VTFEDGYCGRELERRHLRALSIAQIAAKTTPTHGAIAGQPEVNVPRRPRLRLHIVDVEVDKETGRVDQCTCGRGAGRDPSDSRSRANTRAAPSRHRLALNEEILLRRGRADAECELSSIIACRSPPSADDRHADRRGSQSAHPYGLRGVGEVPRRAHDGGHRQRDRRAIAIRPQSLPISPPKLLKLMTTRGKHGG